MINAGYNQAQADHTLFTKQHGLKITTLIMYVDDIVVIGNDEVKIAGLKNVLAREFEIKDLGSLRYFLGIEVARSTQCIFLSQWKYVMDLLKEAGMTCCKPCLTPIETNHKLQEDDSERLINAERYQRLVERLIYS